jgi:hypothetical protein
MSHDVIDIVDPKLQLDSPGVSELVLEKEDYIELRPKLYPNGEKLLKSLRCAKMEMVPLPATVNHDDAEEGVRDRCKRSMACLFLMTFRLCSPSPRSDWIPPRRLGSRPCTCGTSPLISCASYGPSTAVCLLAMRVLPSPPSSITTCCGC